MSQRRAAASGASVAPRWATPIAVAAANAAAVPHAVTKIDFFIVEFFLCELCALRGEKLFAASYSVLSDTIGSILAARLAGTKQATSATSVNVAAIAANVTGSLACTP